MNTTKENEQFTDLQENTYNQTDPDYKMPTTIKEISNIKSQSYSSMSGLRIFPDQFKNLKIEERLMCRHMNSLLKLEQLKKQRKFEEEQTVKEKPTVSKKSK